MVIVAYTHGYNGEKTNICTKVSLTIIMQTKQYYD